MTQKMAILIQFNWPKMDHQKKRANFVKNSFMKITHYTDMA